MRLQLRTTEKASSMGQYFFWVNPASHEWIDCDPFDSYGFLASLSDRCGNRYTDAACTLMEGRWRGDPVVYLGDYCDLRADDPRAAMLGALFGEYPYDAVMDGFEDVSGLFACAEGLRHDAYLGDEPRSVPYDGPFDLEVAHRRYVMEDGRREFVDRELAPVHAIYDCGGYSWDRWDPVPWLLRPSDLDDPWEGRWVAGRVRVSDEPPTPGYRDVSADAYLSYGWSLSAVCAPDEDIRAALASLEFAAGLAERGIRAVRGGDVELHGAVELLGGILTEAR